MSTLEDLQPNAAIRGILPDSLVTVISVQWFGSEALELTYKNPTGKVANELLYRHDEPRLEIVELGRPWSFDGDGALFRLASEAQRIRLAHLFDPVLAVHTSVVDPLPHQITAVYEAMLPRQPLRFLLADDPGAGKTIMAGLLIKELIARGDLQRCLIVCPGSLAEQWQDELYRRFHLPFEILTNDKLESARTGNWFLETNLAIARLDKLSRNEDVQQKLQAPDCRWDLVVCDEAHKMSATVFGGETKYTKRYHLGQLLSTLTRHFLLMTATPHNGKEADFQPTSFNGQREGKEIIYIKVLHESFNVLSEITGSAIKQIMKDSELTPAQYERLSTLMDNQERLVVINVVLEQLAKELKTLGSIDRTRSLAKLAVEGLDAVLLSLKDIANEYNDTDMEILKNMTSGEGKGLAGIRESYLSAEMDLHAESKALLLSATNHMDRLRSLFGLVGENYRRLAQAA